MDYIEVRLTVPPEALEAVANLLNEQGSGGVAIDDEREATLRAYFPDDERLEERLRAIRGALSDLVAFFPGMAEWREERRRVREEDWANAWRQFYHATHVGRRLVVVPTWESYQPGLEDVVIRMDPGMAFGTGTHPSTALAMRWIETVLGDEPGPRPPAGDVLDVGTGSGILAIAVALLDPHRRVRALDIDPVAVRVARHNVEENGVGDRVRVELGEAGREPPAAYALLLANLTADLLVENAPHFARLLQPGGLLIASGIVDVYADEVRRQLTAEGLVWEGVRSESGWVAPLLAKAAAPQSPSGSQG
ncbi:MAG: 50S ribosomal protein L11 methyltransferase [Clostridia bacterium]|nr:50S ribosomal protein L11 methyltransferase [Clostridia bacterium]